MSASALPDSLTAAMLEVAEDGFVVTDEHGAIVLVNPAAAALLGSGRDELVGRELEPLVPGLDPEHGDRRIVRSRRRDGAEVSLEVGVRTIEVPAGRFAVTVIRDVTERQQQLEALARSEAWLRELIAHAPDGILVVDDDGRYGEANAAMCRLLGYSRDELVGKRPSEIMAPDELARLGRAREQLMASGGAIELIEWTFLHKDGTPIPTEINARVLADGRRQAFVRDIRARKRVELELRVAEAERTAALRELEVALEQCPAGIVLLRGVDGRSITLNRAARAFWGRRFDPARGLEQPKGVLCRPDGTALEPEEFPAARALRGELIEHERFAIRTADGVIVPHEINGAPLVDEHGRITGAIVIAWEVSAVVELERLRAEWNSVIAHDLREPIHGISLFAQQLGRHARRSPELLQRDVAAILELTARLTRMTGDLLDLSRLDANRLTIEWRELDLVACVRASVDRIELQEPGLGVELRVEGPIPRLEGDPQRMAQVMDNLLSNARKYRHAGSPIRVRIARDGDRVTVAVINEGDGIEEVDRRRLFQRFERVGGVSRSGIPGIGLGLHVTRGLIEAHGGTIEVRSVPGKDTTFRFTLPCARPGGAR